MMLQSQAESTGIIRTLLLNNKKINKAEGGQKSPPFCLKNMVN